MRVGLGFDSHEFERGKPLVLGGVRIDFPEGLKGHSDGDALLHSVTDAILGALGEPDIGELFSDKDPKWKGASSVLFLTEALRRMKEKGYIINNLDCVIITDKLKISPIKSKLRGNLSSLLGISEDRVSIKGKRREGLGKENSLTCLCVVLLERVNES